jgi:hypothetical protein
MERAELGRSARACSRCRWRVLQPRPPMCLINWVAGSGRIRPSERWSRDLGGRAGGAQAARRVSSMTVSGGVRGIEAPLETGRGLAVARPDYRAVAVVVSDDVVSNNRGASRSSSRWTQPHQQAAACTTRDAS